MKYRVRLSCGSWYVRLYTEHGNFVDGFGPFATIAEAQQLAREMEGEGIKDWDKGL